MTGAFEETFIDKLGFDPVDFIFIGPVLGDLNGDGSVDLLDVGPFVDLLTCS